MKILYIIESICKNIICNFKRVIMSIKRKNGFSILTIILVIVAVTVAIGIWAISGNSNVGQLSSNTNDIKINAIFNEANNIKGQFDYLLTKGYDPRTIVYIPNVASTNSAPNILDPVNGINIPIPDTSLLNSTLSLKPFWVYNYNTGITGGSMTMVIYLFGINDDICKRINYLLFGSPTIYNAPLNVNYYSTSLSGFSSNYPMVTGTPSFPPGPNGQHYGCFGKTTTPNQNIYYRALK